MEPLRRIGAARSDQPVDDAEVFEYFQAARLDALAARTAERAGRGIYQPEGHATTGQIDRQREAGRACSTDQHIRRELFHVPLS